MLYMYEAIVLVRSQCKVRRRELQKTTNANTSFYFFPPTSFLRLFILNNYIYCTKIAVQFCPSNTNAQKQEVMEMTFSDKNSKLQW